MASGSPAGRSSNSGTKGFDFGSEDILCSYDDYNSPESSNGNHSDPVPGTNSTKDYPKTRMSRPTVFPTPNAYAQPEDSNQELVLTVERTMKKYADNLMRFLEGISSRLSQLELYCYNLDKSIGEMRSDLSRDHGEADAKLKSVDKHLQEVHRSVQILRDKQELAETQKELAKLQLAQKESSSTGGHSQQEERTSTPDSKKQESAPEGQNQQLALALPHQVAPPQPTQLTRAPEQQQSVPPPSQPPPQIITSQQQPSYYMGSTQLPNPPTQPQQPPQVSYLAADSSYRPQQVAVAPPPQQNQVNQPAPIQQYPQYQQQWAQPSQTAQPPQQQQAQAHTQIRGPAPSNVYQSYIPSQPMNAPSHESLSGSMAMQVPPSGIPQPGAVSRGEALPYGYGGGASRPQSMPPPQHMKGGDGYPAQGNHPAMSSGGSYMIYESDGARQHHPSQAHFTQGGSGYPPPANVSLHNPHSQQPPPSAGSGMMMRVPGSPPQFVRNHPYNELIEKMASMGYRGDHVASVIQRLEESGQPVDFNSVLDRLNGHSSGQQQRGW